MLASQSRRDFEVFVGREHKNDIILVAYMSDGWGASIRSTQTCKIAHHQVARRGQFRHEFGLQRAFAKAVSAMGKPSVTMLFSETIGTLNGRSAMHFCTLACEFVGTPRSIGHRDISLTVYVFDGGLKDALSRYLQGRHSMLYRTEVDLGDEAHLLELSDLTFAVRCASHVASSAVNHGLDLLKEGPETNKVAYIAIASVRQSMWALHRYVPDFVLRYAQFSDEPSGPPEEIASWWRMLGVEESMVEELVLVDPRWDGANLLVSGALRHDVNSISLISACARYMLQFENFVSARWCGVGNSMRLYMRSRSVGLQGLIGICKEEHVSQYHLAGHEQLVPCILGFMAVAAVGAYPAESFLKEPFVDDRILRRKVFFRATIDDEVRRIMSLPNYVWIRLGALVGGSYDARRLKDMT
jgi:hypothetical protein